jgi:zinc/manganese transport system substrate-binding protein
MAKLTIPAALAVLALAVPGLARSEPARHAVAILAAENFYGDVARQIGGAAVTVTSVLSNPDQDPHLFEASPSVARAVAGAQIVIYNGVDYDPWAAKLLLASPNMTRKTFIVADLAGKHAGDNPHIWYDPATMLALAQRLASSLIGSDPAHKADYTHNLATFEASLQPVLAKIATLRTRLAGTPVTATEPVFGYMFNALGMVVRNQAFQLAVMNGTEPSASDVAAFENDLKTHQVKLLVYNRQASDPVADRMQKIATASQLPIVPVTETEPAGTSYQTWMLGELDAIDRALPK